MLAETVMGEGEPDGYEQVHMHAYLGWCGWLLRSASHKTLAACSTQEPKFWWYACKAEQAIQMTGCKRDRFMSKLKLQKLQSCPTKEFKIKQEERNFGKLLAFQRVFNTQKVKCHLITCV